MKRRYKYVDYALLVASLFVLIWSSGVIKRNHVNYGELVESYGSLVQVYEEQSDHATMSVEVSGRIEYLKSDIDSRFQQGQKSSVKPSLGFYYIWFILGLVGIAVVELMRGNIRSSETDNASTGLRNGK